MEEMIVPALMIIAMILLFALAIYLFLVENTDMTSIDTNSRIYDVLSGTAGIIMLIFFLVGGIFLIFTVC
jgi:uncharacterized membrane protein